jgi:hypothetical protein
LFNVWFITSKTIVILVKFGLSHLKRVLSCLTDNTRFRCDKPDVKQDNTHFRCDKPNVKQDNTHFICDKPNVNQDNTRFRCDKPNVK